MSSITDNTWFEFTTSNELKKFQTYLNLIENLVEQKIELLNKNIISENMFFTAEEAFGKVLSIILSSSTSDELIEFYQKFSILELDLDSAEIIVDSLYDEARFRSLIPGATESDKKFFSLFTSYNSFAEALDEYLDGIINALLSLYELSEASFEEKRTQLIKQSLPVIANQAENLSVLAKGEYEDTWLLFLIACFKNDVTTQIKSCESRFRNFFPPSELNKIQKMNPEQVQSYLASAAAENSHMREAKNLLKIIQENDFLIKELAKLEQALNITPEMLEQARTKLEERANLINEPNNDYN